MFTYHTDEEYLGTVLYGAELIVADEANPGMFHTVDGEKADWNENKSYWAFYVDNNYAVKGIYETPMENGKNYKLEYTLG